MNALISYYCEFKAFNIDAYLYKIRNNSVKSRYFLSVDNEDKIEVILSDYEGYSLHEFIDENELLQPIIDFDLPIEILNAITSKLSYSQTKIYIAMHLEMFV